MSAAPVGDGEREEYHALPKIDTFRHTSSAWCGCKPKSIGTTSGGLAVWLHNEVDGINGDRR